MSDLVAIAYPDLATAQDVMNNLAQAQKEKIIELEDAVVVERRTDGKIKLHQTANLTGVGAASGALWGGLIGLLFLAPWLGMAVGAASGAAAGKMSDVGVDDKFMKELGDKLEPGTAAVFVLVRKMTADKLLANVKHQGHIIHSSLSTEDEATIQGALDRAGEVAKV